MLKIEDVIARFNIVGSGIPKTSFKTLRREINNLKGKTRQQYTYGIPDNHPQQSRIVWELNRGKITVLY